MSDETTTTEPTVTVRRIPGARRVTHAAAGFVPAFEFGSGDGPWEMPASQWDALSHYIDDAFVIVTDGNPFPITEQE